MCIRDSIYIVVVQMYRIRSYRKNVARILQAWLECYGLDISCEHDMPSRRQCPHNMNARGVSDTRYVLPTGVVHASSSYQVFINNRKKDRHGPWGYVVELSKQNSLLITYVEGNNQHHHQQQ